MGAFRPGLKRHRPTEGRGVRVLMRPETYARQPVKRGLMKSEKKRNLTQMCRTARGGLEASPGIIANADQAGIEAAMGNIETAESMYRQLLADNPKVSSGVWLELARLKVRQ